MPFQKDTWLSGSVLPGWKYLIFIVAYLIIYDVIFY